MGPWNASPQYGLCHQGLRRIKGTSLSQWEHKITQWLTHESHEGKCAPAYIMEEDYLPGGWPLESEVAQSCPTLCDPMDCSLSGSSVHGIFQARVLQWIAISFSRGSSRPRNQTQVSCIAGRCFTVWAAREAWGMALSQWPYRFMRPLTPSAVSYYSWIMVDNWK